MINCIIIDDEPLAREGIKDYVSRIPFLNLTDSFEDPLKAADVIEKADLVFLDIEMPAISGLEYLSSLAHPPLTIIITAYPNHAVKGYELNALDYLLKPVPFERFLKACNKAKEYYEYKKGSSGAADYFFVKSDLKHEKIILNDILFIESMQNYVAIHTVKEKHIVHMTMKYLEDMLPVSKFVRIHRSYIVALGHIDNIEGNIIRVGNHHLPISRDNKEEILNKILNGKTLK